MAYTTIDDGSVYFQTDLYSSSGGGGSITVTNDGNSDLQPDLIWIKVRNDSNDHNMFDSSRSNFGERIFPNQASASDSVASVSASSDGFATGTEVVVGVFGGLLKPLIASNLERLLPSIEI